MTAAQVHSGTIGYVAQMQLGISKVHGLHASHQLTVLDGLFCRNFNEVLGYLAVVFPFPVIRHAPEGFIGFGGFRVFGAFRVYIGFGGFRFLGLS